MANYTKVFDNPYPSGWENLPSENTPITAEALQEHTDAISHIENYLNDNPIKDATDVSWNQIQTSGDKIAEITIDGQKQNVFAPQQKGGASTWSEVAEKPFSTIGSGLRVQNDVLQSTDLSGTKAEFDAIKDSLPDGSAFDTTDENVGGGSNIELKLIPFTPVSNSNYTNVNCKAYLYGKILVGFISFNVVTANGSGSTQVGTFEGIEFVDDSGMSSTVNVGYSTNYKTQAVVRPTPNTNRIGLHSGQNSTNNYMGTFIALVK